MTFRRHCGRSCRNFPVGRKGWSPPGGSALVEFITSWATRASAKIRRSAEHTSELQSLMRTSYAVFCLTKKRRHILDLTCLHDTTTISEFNDTLAPYSLTRIT